MRINIIVTVLILVFFSFNLSAAKRYWIAATGAKWNNTANWAATSGGVGGSSVPGASDTAYFDGNGLGNDTIDVNVSVRHLSIASGYTGIIVQGSNTLTIGVTGAILSGGTFSGGSGNITLNGPFTISGCAFTNTSGTFSTNSNFTYSSGSFTHNNGTMRHTATSTITGSVTMYKVEFAPSSASTFTIASGTTITVDNDLHFLNSAILILNTGTISAKKDVYASNTGSASTGGSGTITFTGSSKQTLYGHNAINGPIPNVSINKSDTLVIQDTVCIGGSFTRTAGIVNAGTSTVVFKEGGTTSITGSTNFNNLTFYHVVNNCTYTISSGTTITVNNKLEMQGDKGLSLNTGTLHAKGNITLGNTNTSLGGGTAVIVINGSGTQILAGTGTANSGRLCTIQINKSASDTLKITGQLTARENWTYIAGIVSAAPTSTVYFTDTKTISGSHQLANVAFTGQAAYIYTLSSGTVLGVSGNLSLSGSNSITINTGTLAVAGNITVTNTSTSTGGTATVQIDGIGNQTLTGSGTTGAGKLPNININKPSGTLTLASIISVTGNWVYTSGVVNPGTSSVALYGTFNIDGQQAGSSNVMSFHRIGVQTGTRTVTGNLDVNDNLTVASGCTLTIGNFNVNVGGNWNSQGSFSQGATSLIMFDGNSFNRIQGPSGAVVTFKKVAVNRAAGSLTLVNPVKIDSFMTLHKGRIKTTRTNYLEFGDNATCTINNNDSAYVHGPVRKIGNDAFSFPLGDTTLHDSIAYHPLAITAPGTTGDRFEAEYRAIQQTYGDSLVDTLNYISDCEYWNIERLAGTSNVAVTLNWNSNSCGVENYSDLRIAGWDGNKWVDRGAAEIIPGSKTGSIRTQSTLNFGLQVSQTLTLAQRPNSDPYAILKKKIDAGYYQCSNGKLMFRFDDEYNDPDGKLAFRIYDDGYRVKAGDHLIASGNVPNVFYGSNYYLLNVLSCSIAPNSSIANGFFILEIITEKNERWFLRFKHTTTITQNCTGGSSGQQ